MLELSLKLNEVWLLYLIVRMLLHFCSLALCESLFFGVSQENAGRLLND